MENIFHTEKLKKLHVLILLKRRLRDGLIMVYEYLPGEQIFHSQFFNLPVKTITRFSSWRLKQDKFRFVRWNSFLTLKVVKIRKIYLGMWLILHHVDPLV